MGTLTKYRRKPSTPIIAVQLDLETDGFSYEKWGGTQRCEAGDWLVKNGDDTYTIKAEVFAKTYREVADGRYAKTVPIWAERAEVAGTIQTHEGTTDYEAGDMIVFNNPDRTDGYAISAERFEELYEPAK